jgi:hypothetical protein
MERWAGYRLASALAAARVWFGLHAFAVVVREGGRAGDPAHAAGSPLVFVGVGERDFSRAGMGARLPGRPPALHAVVVHARSRGAVLALALRAATGGLAAVAETDAVDLLLVDACEVRMRRRRGRVAVDGEVVAMDAPLAYRLDRGAFRVVVPAGAATGPPPGSPNDASGAGGAAGA